MAAQFPFWVSNHILEPAVIRSQNSHSIGGNRINHAHSSTSKSLHVRELNRNMSIVAVVIVQNRSDELRLGVEQ